MPDQTTASVRCYPFNDIGLGQPGKRIVQSKRLTERRGEDAAKARQSLRMRGSGCPSADNLPNRGQVQTDHAILKKTDAVFAK
jgi:hypothetical protein